MNRTIIGLVTLIGVILSIVSLANAQTTFSFSITCEGSKFQAPGKVGSANAIWNWTVNGVPENAGSGKAICSEINNDKNTVSGTGAVPANANGITVTLTAQVESGKTCTVSTSQSFSNKGTVNIKNLSVTCQGVESGLPTFEKAIFNLQS
ncbi:hypothetical protein J2P12_00355 [Candidatus Bathyarchaeota archaeon]|nr:hypothetical protein [Candidatus Bathyarchaeota archaeon]